MNNSLIQHYLLDDQRVGTLPETQDNVIAIEWQQPASLYRYCLYLELEQDSISQVRYKVYGCAITIACLAWVAEYLEGKTLVQAQMLTDKNIIDGLQIIPEKQHGATVIYGLVQKALKKAATEEAK